MTDAPMHAWGLGLATVTDDGTVLDVWFPEPQLGAEKAPTRAAPATWWAASRGSPGVTTYGG